MNLEQASKGRCPRCKGLLYKDADKIKQCVVCGYENYSELKPKKNRLGKEEINTWLN